MKFFDLFPFVSFIVLSILIVGRVIYLRMNGIHLSAKSKKTKKTKYILRPLYLFIMHVWMFEISNSLFHISLLPKIFIQTLLESFHVQIAGSIVVLFSLIIFAITLLQFKQSLRFGMNSNNLGKLITTGIFSVSRNPFFVSIELYFVGIALIFSSPFFIGILLLTIVSIHFFILKEERFLIKNYGEEYQNYVEKVRRYF